VLQVDAIWVTQLAPTGGHRLDRKGRRRPVKRRIKRPILIALGVWPETEHAEVIAWRLTDKEDADDWLAFLSELEALGVELIIHDGGAGLCATLNTIYFGAAEQQRLFHKLRNISHAIGIDDDQLSAKEKRRRRRASLRDFRHIWDAKQLPTVLQRYRTVVRRYRTTQPAAVQSLRTDFRATIAYFTVLHRHPHWNRRFLRTTRWLERFNHSLRRRLRTAAAYHSDAGLCSMIAHRVNAFQLTHAHTRISTIQDT
jgi:transposase-like protein